ncbi:gliding motility-associated C-terminal domain-containing protein [Chondrinema litorale]|uniref:T9SS type B sorting domain-containing protein n=1 Tax=Chondrinema litorale TaxID=2994555 RepID=UPI0025438BC9|nr:gliding motility-associated C-terminal domain-containing protein [Chondrinema litorale]UZR94537.1 gliding motility-associated C-terminal domain-containing protein [Chondrinema litorale]
MKNKWIAKSLTVLLGIILANIPSLVHATHIRAGDLTAVRISSTSLTYRFTVFLYRDNGGVPPQPGTFEFGYSSAEAVMVEPISLGFIDGVVDNQGDATEILMYQVEHTFPSPGGYKVSYYEQNRNPSVSNMFNSGNTAFYIESVFSINPAYGLNSSPVLLIAPVDLAAVGQKFIHNPGAYDADGDSLSYRLTVCKQGKDEDGNPIEVVQYSYPDEYSYETEDGQTPPTFSINPINGDLIWDAPGEVGEYNVAFYVDEWRNGQQIGAVNRDMQIIVVDNPNDRPELEIPNDTCIVAGTTLEAIIKGYDLDPDHITLTAEGGLFSDPDSGGHTNQATFEVTGLQPPNGEEEGVFSWETTCDDIRTEPYQATFKVRDEPEDGYSLVDIQTWRITVVGPAPENLVADVDLISNSVELNWDDYICNIPGAAMTIWRRRGAFDFEPDNCETGLPAYTGYEKIAEVDVDQTTYFDDNEGLGLERGVTYCYRIYVSFPSPKGGESYASIEACVFIPQLAPYIIETSVTETSRTDGKVNVTWTKPIGIDVDQYPKPWTYSLLRNNGLEGDENTVELGTFSENDTTFLDETGLDTERLPYNYKIEFYSDGALTDTSSSASTVFLEANSALESVVLTWDADVPWSNASSKFPKHYIYREEPLNSGEYILFDSVNISNNGFTYVDDGNKDGFTLVEKTEYCYKVLTVGTYDNPDIRDSLLNMSQEACAVILDTTAPCPPILSVTAPNCDDFEIILDDQTVDCSPTDTLFSNTLEWENDSNTACDQEIESYNVYYSAREDGEFELIAENVLNLTYLHDDISSLAGCYAVTALDGTGNESAFSNIVCVDNCPFYQLPNAFTPNDDGVNDVFRPYKCIKFIKSVEFTVFNRWGEKMYESNDDIYINWEGIDNDGDQLSSGIYYYHVKLQTIRLNEDDEEVNLKGWVKIIDGQGQQ